MHHAALAFRRFLLGNSLTSIASQFPNLRSVVLRGSRNLTAAFGSFRAEPHTALNKLQHLDLHCRYGKFKFFNDRAIPWFVGVAPNLQRLYLRGCDNISDEGVAHLANFNSLQFLMLSCNRALSGASFAALTSLWELRFGMCSGFTDAGLASLSSLQNLRGILLRVPKRFHRCWVGLPHQLARIGA